MSLDIVSRNFGKWAPVLKRAIPTAVIVSGIVNLGKEFTTIQLVDKERESMFYSVRSKGTIAVYSMVYGGAALLLPVLLMVGKKTRFSLSSQKISLIAGCCLGGQIGAMFLEWAALKCFSVNSGFGCGQVHQAKNYKKLKKAVAQERAISIFGKQTLSAFSYILVGTTLFESARAYALPPLKSWPSQRK